MASRDFGTTPAKKEENSPMIRWRIANGNEAGAGRGLGALETNEADLQTEADSQPVAMGKKGNDNWPVGTAAQFRLAQSLIEFQACSNYYRGVSFRALQSEGTRGDLWIDFHN